MAMTRLKLFLFYSWLPAAWRLFGYILYAFFLSICGAGVECLQDYL